MCRGCAALEITCHGGETKPDWMDGAARQREMAQRFKARIKDGASARRERRAGTSAYSQTAFIVTSQQDYVSEQVEPGRPGHPRGSRAKPPAEDGPSSAMPLGAQMEECDVAVASPDDASSPSSLLSSSSSTTTSDGAVTSPTARSILDLAHKLPSDLASSTADFPSLGQAWELDFILIYLDYVFPFLFPFYRPPLVGTSRAWLLLFLRQNSAVFHSVLSLSSFFFTVGLKDVFPDERGPCKSVIWGQVVKQSNMSFAMIQKDLGEINGTGATQAGLLEKARIMETIVQLLMFELFVGRSADWNTHLTPALSLFEDIFEGPSRSFPAKSGLACVLEEMAWPPPSHPGLERPIWNPDQAAFRFFTAVLLFVDIVASTSLERAPRLRRHHSRLLADLAPEEIAGPVDLSAFVGCRNWVLLAVGEIATLDAWKKEMERAGSLSRPELVERANGISRVLEQGLASLDTSPPPPSDTHHSNSNSNSNNSIGHLQPYYHANLRHTGKSLSAAPTRIWAHAAQIYLSVVVSGWAPSDAPVRRAVAQVLTLVQAVDSAAQLHTLAWPVCVAGCLAEGDAQEHEFGTVVTGTGDSQLLSAVREAGRIMQAVWRRRRRRRRSRSSRQNSADGETWDLAACFRVLGTPALLV